MDNTNHSLKYCNETIAIEYEKKLVYIIDRFKENEDKQQILSSFKDLASSLYKILKSEGKTDEDIIKEFQGICFNVGIKVSHTLSEEQEHLKDVLACALLNFFVGIKHQQTLSPVKQ